MTLASWNVLVVEDEADSMELVQGRLCERLAGADRSHPPGACRRRRLPCLPGPQELLPPPVEPLRGRGVVGRACGGVNAQRTRTQAGGGA